MNDHARAETDNTPKLRLVACEGGDEPLTVEPGAIVRVPRWRMFALSAAFLLAAATAAIGATFAGGTVSASDFGSTVTSCPMTTTSAF